MNFAGNKMSGSIKIANVFNQHSASVFREDTSPPSVPLASADRTICPEDMYFAKKSKVKDPDFSFVSWVVRKIAANFIENLFQLPFSQLLLIYLDKIIDEQEFRKCWKKAIIKPLHKKESRIDIKNYRPVSMLCALSLICEKFWYIKFRYRLLKNFGQAAA